MQTHPLGGSSLLGQQPGFRTIDFGQRGLLELRRNPSLSSPEDCARACREDEPPRICYYHFTLELYNVLGAWVFMQLASGAGLHAVTNRRLFNKLLALPEPRVSSGGSQNSTIEFKISFKHFRIIGTLAVLGLVRRIMETSERSVCIWKVWGSQRGAEKIAFFCVMTPFELAYSYRCLMKMASSLSWSQR